MEIGGFTAWEWFVLMEHELLLFAGIFFLIGALDELAVDGAYLWLKLTGRLKRLRVDTSALAGTSLAGPVAVFIPAWRENAVIGTTIAHMLGTWRYAELRLYVGCYRNDPATLTAATEAVSGDPRARTILVERNGPTTKADCLNGLYEALKDDERRGGMRTRMVVLHDAEDMVDPAALGLLDRAMDGADLVQLPVLPEPQPASRWIAGHYCEEFAEAHGKGLVVRDALGAAIPLAGVGCAISRDRLEELATLRGNGLPFAPDCLTEDYELGLGIGALGGTTRFLRARNELGRLIATRSCFPVRLDQAVRQKSRWMHGIALQGWDRLGWNGGVADTWMRLRDRRGPFIALLLAVAYLLLILVAIGWLLASTGVIDPVPISPLVHIVLLLNLASLLWRSAWRFAFTARAYGWNEGLHAVLRIPVANIIAIMAGWRALMAYIRTLAGAAPVWDKTEHNAHPARIEQRRVEQ